MGIDYENKSGEFREEQASLEASRYKEDIDPRDFVEKLNKTDRSPFMILDLREKHEIEMDGPLDLPAEFKGVRVVNETLMELTYGISLG